MTGRIKSAVRSAIALVRGPKGESIRYIFIGGCTTLVDYVTYHLLVRGLGMSVTAGNVISTVLAIVFAYVTNKTIVFRSRTVTTAGTAAELLRFVTARLLTMALEIGGVYVFVTILGQDDRVGKVEAIVLVVIANFFLSKFLVFKQQRQTDG